MFENIGENWRTDMQLRKEVFMCLRYGKWESEGLTATITTRQDPKITAAQPESFAGAIVNIELTVLRETTDTPIELGDIFGKVDFNIGNVAVGFESLAEWGCRNVMPAADDTLIEITGMEEEELTNVLNHFADTIDGYVKAYIELGPNPQSSLDAVEREKICAFLRGATSPVSVYADRDGAVVVSAQMDVGSHDPDVLAKERLMIDVARRVEEKTHPVGKVVTTAGGAAEAGILDHLVHFSLSTKESEAVNDLIKQKLLRFIQLGPETVAE